MISGHSHDGISHSSGGVGLTPASGGAGSGALWSASSNAVGAVGDHGHSHSHSGAGSGGGGDSCCGDIGSHLTEGFFIARDFRGDVEGDACLTLMLSQRDAAACVWRETERTTQTIKSQLCAKGLSTLPPVIELSPDVLGSKDAYKQLLRSLPTSEKRAGLLGVSGLAFTPSTNSNGALSVNIAELLSHDYTSLSSYNGANIRPSQNGDRAVLTAKSSSGATSDSLAVKSDELTALLMAHWISQADEVVEEIASAGASAGKKGSGKRKGRGTQASITLVVPNSFGGAPRHQLSLAAKHLNVTIRNIFSKGLAAVAGALYKNGGVDRSLLATSIAAQLHERRKQGVETSSNSNSVVIIYFSVAGRTVEISCVRAEAQTARSQPPSAAAEGAGGTKNTMGFGRLVSLGQLGFVVDADEGNWSEGAVGNMVENLIELVPNVKKSDVSALLYDCSEASLQRLKDCLRSEGRDGVTSKLVAVRSQPSDAVRGGCVLSAAELQSAKEFVHNSADDSWSTEFNLAVGEENSGGAVGITTSTAGPLKEPGNPTEILPAHTRLYKPDVGPAASKSALTQKLEYSFSFKSDRSVLTYSVPPDAVGAGESAAIQIWQREIVSPVAVSDMATSKSSLAMKWRWRQLASVRPLIGEDSEGHASDMTSADVTVSILPRLGHHSVAVQQGTSLRDARRGYWGYIKSIGFFAVMFLLVGVYLLYQRFEKQREHQVLVDWLTDFYQKHAPEKLQDSQFVEKTLAKYSNKIFVLWRQLERTYKVKFDPPSVILEENDF